MCPRRLFERKNCHQHSVNCDTATPHIRAETIFASRHGVHFWCSVSRGSASRTTANKLETIPGQTKVAQLCNRWNAQRIFDKTIFQFDIAVSNTQAADVLDRTQNACAHHLGFVLFQRPDRTHSFQQVSAGRNFCDNVYRHNVYLASKKSYDVCMAQALMNADLHTWGQRRTTC